MRVICIIPARGGSTRIKDKNIADLGGHPLIAWTIRDALASNLIDRVIVSTNSKKIKDISIEYGAEVVDRPDYLSKDDSKIEDAVKYTIEKLKEKPDLIVLLQCTTPFRNKGDIDEGIIKLNQDNADSLFFATEFDKFIWTREHDSINYDFKDRPRTQDKKWEIVELGNYIIKPEVLYKFNNRLGGKITHLLVDKISEIDIDNQYDLALARLLVEKCGVIK